MLKKVFGRCFQEDDYPSLALIIIGTIIWSLTMVKSGLVYPFGMGFWGPNGHDGIWHIAVIKNLARGSWAMPLFAGETLKNYHVGFDLLVSWFHKLTFIPVRTLYFQVMPPILALLIGIFAYKFVYTWTRSRLKGFWATFFVYFGGSFGWLVTLLRSREIGGESLFWSQQSISTLLNPPFALSLFLMFLGLYLLLKAIRYKNKKLLIATSFIFGILIQIKVYAGILALTGLFAAGIWRLLKRKGVTLIKIFTGALIISILLFSPLNKDSQASVVFKPFWFLETMMNFSDRFHWSKFGEAMVNYKLGGVWLKGTIAYSVAFMIFIIGNFGARLINLPLVFRWIRRPKKIKYIEVFIATVIVAGIAIPMFFVQRGTAWNTIQFMYYSLIFSGILAGVALSELIERAKKTTMRRTILSAAIVLLTIPTTIGTLRHYLPSRPPAKISNEELEALRFLSEQPYGVVLTYPFDREAAEAAADNPPRPLYLYESTAYVSAFSGKSVYLEDEVNLDITGYDWEARREKVEEFIGTQDIDQARSFLSGNNISYIYLVDNQQTKLGERQLGIEKIFENSEVNIYKKQ